jgi:hypothetical protein
MVELMEIIADDFTNVMQASAGSMPPVSGFLSDLHRLHQALRADVEVVLTGLMA